MPKPGTNRARLKQKYLDQNGSGVVQGCHLLFVLQCVHGAWWMDADRSPRRLDEAYPRPPSSLGEVACHREEWRREAQFISRFVVSEEGPSQSKPASKAQSKVDHFQAALKAWRRGIRCQNRFGGGDQFGEGSTESCRCCSVCWSPRNSLQLLGEDDPAEPLKVTLKRQGCTHECAPLESVSICASSTWLGSRNKLYEQFPGLPSWSSSKKHFHPKTLSSKNTFVPNDFIQNMRQFHPRQFHPKNGSSKNGFVQRHFHPKPVSSNDTVIQNHFHPKP